MSSSKDAFEAVQAIFTTVAILCAGGWAIWHYIIQRKNFPCAELSQETKFWDISETSRLVRVTVTVKNPSETLLCVFKGHTWVQQMKPWPTELLRTHISSESEMESKESEFPWPLIKEKIHDMVKELEPKESDQFTTDFIIENGYEQVLIYTWVENFKKQKRNIGWSVSTVVNFKDEEDRAKVATSASSLNMSTALFSKETAQSKDKRRPPVAKAIKRKEQ